MLKIIVFDGGWGGEVVAQYLEQELKVAEVVRLIDWHGVPYEDKSEAEILQIAEENLQRYIGKVDLIVLAGYAVSLVLPELQNRYPMQKFVGMGINYERILRARIYPERVAILAGKTVSESRWRQNLRENLVYSTLILPDCSGWEALINEDLLTKEVLRSELAWDFVIQRKAEKVRKKVTGKADKGLVKMAGEKDDVRNLKKISAEKQAIWAALQSLDKITVEQKRKEEEEAGEIVDCGTLKPDVVLLLNTHFWEVKAELEEIFGWRVRVLDFREKLLHDVCAALKLRGVHGGRAK